VPDDVESIISDAWKVVSCPVVMVFILSGYEHCIANMFYFTIAKAWSLNTVGYLAVMTLGNAVGGMFIPFVRKGFITEKKAVQK